MSLRILLLAHSFNSLTQRLWVELEERGHACTLEFDIDDRTTEEAAALARPDLVLAPYLRRAIPERVWRNHLSLVVHPGPEGDRGPSALEWAILEGRREWGVTVLRAEAEMDAGPFWASRTFPLREGTKSSLYRNEVTEAAVAMVLEAVELFPGPAGRRPAASTWRPAVRQKDRAIDWSRDGTAVILRKIRAADGAPGVLDEAFFLFDAEPAEGLSGPPGSLLAHDGRAIARATRDGAVWIGRMRADRPFALKQPAARAVGDETLARVPRVPGPPDILYEERGAVGLLHFPFPGGAMDVDRCHRLREAFRAATRRPTRVIALMGGPDFWCNGMDLVAIEAAESPAEESWRTINAIDDLCRDLVTCESHLTLAALEGNAGAGGVFLALAADRVVARAGVVLNPHYKGMGNLYGSEYWTYLLPRRCGPGKARRVTEARLPMGTREALALGLIDARLAGWRPEFRIQALAEAEALAADPGFSRTLTAKREARAADEATRPLESYRADELQRMALNFQGFDTSYHVARHDFVHKIPKSRTPFHLARHRAGATHWP